MTSSLLLIAAMTSAADRNVVLMIADDLGMELGCYGDAFAKTPHLDRLSGESLRFTHAFCTTASCSPSRSVMFTGLHNHANGQYGLAHAEHNFFQRPGVPNIFGLAKAAGFRTAIIGKKHVQPESAYTVDYQPRVNARHPMQMARAAKEFFGQPGNFLAVVGFTDPHRARSNFANDGKGAPKPPATFDPQATPVPAFLPDNDVTKADLADYRAAVARLDQGVGEVLKALEESGRAQETLVIFLSDNGMPFPGAKCGLYDPGMRLPLIVRKPGAKPAVTDALASWVDVAPTMLAWLGVQAPAMHGRSLLPLHDEPNAAGWDEVYASHTFHEITMFYPMRVVRTRTHKLIHNLAHELPFPIAQDQRDSPTWQWVLKNRPERFGCRTLQAFSHRPEYELYDLTADPNECRNLAADERSKPIFDELRGKLQAFQQRTKDPFTEGISRDPG